MRHLLPPPPQKTVPTTVRRDLSPDDIFENIEVLSLKMCVCVCVESERIRRHLYFRILTTRMELSRE